MTATEVIESYQKLPPTERTSVVNWILADTDDDAVLEVFDRLPRPIQMSEEEILTLPRRARVA